MIFQTAECGEGVHGLLFLIPPTLAHPRLFTRVAEGWGTWVGRWQEGDGQTGRAAPTKEAG